MSETASTPERVEHHPAPNGLRLIQQGSMWIFGGVAAGCLITVFSSLVPQPQWAPPRSLASAVLAGAAVATVGLRLLIVGAIHYAREVWKD